MDEDEDAAVVGEPIDDDSMFIDVVGLDPMEAPDELGLAVAEDAPTEANDEAVNVT